MIAFRHKRTFWRRIKVKAFEIMPPDLAIGQGKLPLEQIQHVQVTARIRRLKSNPDTFRPISQLAMLPPLPHLCGYLVITTLFSRCKFRNVEDVMEIMAAFLRFGVSADAVYVREDGWQPYLYPLVDPTLEKCGFHACADGENHHG